MQRLKLQWYVFIKAMKYSYKTVVVKLYLVKYSKTPMTFDRILKLINNSVENQEMTVKYCTNSPIFCMYKKNMFGWVYLQTDNYFGETAII